MKYRDIHTGKVQEWHVEEVRANPSELIEVMVAESGDHWAKFGTLPFLDHHEVVEEAPKDLE